MTVNQEKIPANGEVIDVRLASILQQHDGQQIIDLLRGQKACLKEHQKRVAQMASMVAITMGLSNAQEEAVYVAASLHDIGLQQFSFPSNISKYNHFKMMEQFNSHPEKGAELVKDISLDVPVGQIILQHHERLDGSGFPHHIKDIMIEAQIIAAVDIFDGIYSLHSNNPASALAHACHEVYKMRTGLLDSEVIDTTITHAKGNSFSSYF